MQNTSVEIVETQPGVCQVRGALTFATARRAREVGERCFQASPATDVQVDCSAVTDGDSAGLAVLIDWLATAKRAGRTLRFTNLPAEICAVARISEVEDLLRDPPRS